MQIYTSNQKTISIQIKSTAETRPELAVNPRRERLYERPYSVGDWTEYVTWVDNMQWVTGLKKHIGLKSTNSVDKKNPWVVKPTGFANSPTLQTQV